MEIRQARMIVNKSGKGSSTFRATLPTVWIREMGLAEDIRDLVLEFDGKEIKIKNKKEMEDMKLSLNVMTSEGLAKLTMEGKLLEKTKLSERIGKKESVKGELVSYIDDTKITNYNEKWEITKTNGDIKLIEVTRRVTNYEGKITEEIFEDYFSEKIVYEDWDIKELEEWGTIEIAE